jgi:hypothetical protein
MTIDEIDQRLIFEKPTAVWPIEKVIKDALADVFKKRIGPYSIFSPEDRPATPTILIGLQFSAATLLYKASGTKLRRLRESDCIGMGVILGKSLIGQLGNPELSLTQTGLVAIYILHQTKRWVDSCGGKSDVLLLSNRDMKIIRMPTGTAEEIETHFDQFNLVMRNVLIQAADATVPHLVFDKLMKQFQVDILGLRGKFMEMEEFYKRIYELTGTPMPKEVKEFVNKPKDEDS